MESYSSIKLDAHLIKIIDSIPTAIVMINAEGQIVLVNTQTESLFGYTRKELLGEPIELLVPHRFRRQHPKHRHQFLSNATVRPMGQGRDLFGLRKDGIEFPIEIGLNPIRNDGKLFVLSAIVDITERKRLEARFRATLESAPTAMIMIDQVGTMVLVNTETTHLFGYQTNELLNNKVEVLVPDRFKFLHPKLRTEYFAEAKARRMGEGRDLFGLRKDGTEFPIEIGLNLIQTDEGIFALAAIVDLTERNRTLEQLRKANEALELSNIELQQFAYIASHDLQTPLRAVSGFAQCLQQDYGDRFDEKANDYLDRMVDASSRMKSLITDLLAFSRIDSRAKPFDKVDLNEVFADALTMLGITDDSHEQVRKDQLPSVMGDRSQLMQLLMNLIGNGLKYHSDAPIEISVTAHRKNGDWIIEVKDNGIGIDPSYFVKIFEIFRRLHTRTQYPGTGIGLALCRRIVHRHGGRIWVDSEPGKGSSFFFTLRDSVNQLQNLETENDERSKHTVG